jgi:hypothetical protein
MKISSHDARSSLSPRAGRGRGEGASTLLERCKSSSDRQDTPCQLRIAERPPQPILLPARGEKEPRAARGERWGERSRSRDAPAPEACRPKPRSFCLQKNKGRRSAEKARLSRGASPRSGCCHPSALRARPRVQRNALAFRRSTAVLTAAPKRRSSVQAALHAMQCAGVTRILASRLSEAPRAPVVMPAGSMPGPPGSGSDEPPPAGTAPAPSVGVTG